MKRKKIFIYTLLVLLVAGTGAGFYIYKEYNRKHKDTANLKPDFSAPAAQLLGEFGKDEKSANAKYLGKVLQVDGLVKDIVKDEKGFYTIVVGDTASMSSVRCSIDSVYNGQGATVNKGTAIAVKGICSGYNADEMLGSDLILNRAVIEKN